MTNIKWEELLDLNKNVIPGTLFSMFLLKKWRSMHLLRLNLIKRFPLMTSLGYLGPLKSLPKLQTKYKSNITKKRTKRKKTPT